MPFLFVYGTLKRGCCRNQLLIAQRFVRDVYTTANYRLFDVGSYPGMVESQSGYKIAGELYDVSLACLEKLDIVEGVDEGLYRRSNVSLLRPDDSCDAITYIYLPPTLGYREISHWPPTD